MDVAYLWQISDRTWDCYGTCSLKCLITFGHSSWLYSSSTCLFIVFQCPSNSGTVKVICNLSYFVARKSPFFLSILFLAVISIFKPYPTISDAVTYLMLLIQLGPILDRARMLIVTMTIMSFVAALAPINWYYWINQGSGNANFYFAIILLYNGAQILLVANVTFSFLLDQICHDNPGLDTSQVYQR
jgi:hypothetical protein